MYEIGGFFELELRKGKEFHSEAINLNTGRNALEYILRVNNYKKVYLPFFICDSVLEPILKLNIAFEFYHVDMEWNICLDSRKLQKDDLLVYVNYFGLNDNKVNEIVEESSRKGFNLCIDNSQAFFSEAIKGIDTIYSARKFFGVPDGAYLYSSKVMETKLQKSLSYEQSNHLLRRIDLNAPLAYKEYKKNDDLHKHQPIKYMSNLSKRILSSIDYGEVKKKRWKNFYHLDAYLDKTNHLPLQDSNISCPMVYPYLSPNGSALREYLISQGIYVAQYWPNILEKMEHGAFEYNLAKNLVAIPIDQRYGVDEMESILKKVNQFEKDKKIFL